ncbi:MAG TPA: DUF1761 domain-containing protein [Chitinivibrionales bacterium]|nr:DUF1761 domain-containing protein [Chitinivibrionales bacterium]
MGVPINYMAVLVAAFVNYVLGMLWYGVIFGKSWRRMSGIPQMTISLSGIVLGVVGSLLMSYVLAYAVIFGNAYRNAGGAGGGLAAGFFYWLGFVAPVKLGMVIYEKRPWPLWLLNSAYWLISLLAMGALLSAWK